MITVGYLVAQSLVLTWVFGWLFYFVEVLCGVCLLDSYFCFWFGMQLCFLFGFEVAFGKLLN